MLCTLLPWGPSPFEDFPLAEGKFLKFRVIICFLFVNLNQAFYNSYVI